MKCPLRSYEYSAYIDCAGQSCAFADGAGECLIKQALSLYVSGERIKRAEEAEKSKREEMALSYWEHMKNNGFHKADCIIEDPSPCVDYVIKSI